MPGTRTMVRMERTATAGRPTNKKARRSCDMVGIAKDICGQRFGRLTVIARNGSDKNGNASWFCRCDCGTEKSILGQSLRCGAVVSCGCYGKEVNSLRLFKHGSRNHYSYQSWYGMIQRCTNKNNKKWPRYGGRGITVCERWRKFENFLADMGERPEGTSIDRIDNDGNYEPGNCRWATQKQQGNNRGNNIRVIVSGKEVTASEASRMMGADRATVARRIRSGWSVEDSVSIAVGSRR